MYLRNITISGIKCFGPDPKHLSVDLTRPDGSWAGFTVVAGRNGSGKTTFLRCAAMAVSAEDTVKLLQLSFEGWRNTQATVGAGCGIAASVVLTAQDAPMTAGRAVQGAIRHIMFAAALDGRPSSIHYGTELDDPPPFRYSLQAPDPPLLTTDHPHLPNESDRDYESRIIDKYLPERGRLSSRRVFVAGYGPLRRLSGHTSEAKSIMASDFPEARLVSLFREEASLVECVAWLQEVYVKRLERKAGAAEFEANVLKLLGNGLLPAGSVVDHFDSDGLWIERQGTALPLRDLSDGYRMTVALVLDLIHHMYSCFGEFRLIQDGDRWTVPYEGVILIDEIDAHLHVS